MLESSPSLALARVILLILLASGCGQNDATIELGTGTVDFEPLADGDSVVVVAGPQGGFHFIVHARATGIAPGDPTMPGVPDNPRTTFAAFLGDQEVDMEAAPYRLGYQDDGEFQVLPSGRILLLRNEVVPDLYDQEVRITVTIEDKDGDSASDERVIIAIPDPNPPAS